MDDIDFSSNDSVDKRNGWHPEYFEDEENFCDNLVEVIKLEFGPFEKSLIIIFINFEQMVSKLLKYDIQLSDRPVEALQSVMQRRAGYIATMLHLNAIVEEKRRQLSGSR